MALARINRKLRLRDPDTLMAVVQTGGVRKAAEYLHLSQPAVSKAITELEASLGVALLNRSRRGVTVTPFGEALIRRSKVIFDELHRAVDELEHLADPSGGQVHMGCMETVNAGIVGAAIEQLAPRFPRLRVHIESGDSTHLIAHFLRERVCEFIIARPYALPLPLGVLGEPLWCDRLRVVVGMASPFARRRRVSLAELTNERWVLSNNEVNPDSPIVAGFAALGLPFPACFTITSSLNLRFKLLASGQFITLMPDSLLHFSTHRSSMRILPIELPRWRTPTMILTLQDRVLGPAAGIFLDKVRTLARPLGASLQG